MHRQIHRFVCALLALILVLSALPTALAAAYSYDNMLRDLTVLESYALSYHNAHAASDSALELSLIYIRSGRYNSGIWNTMAGSIDSNFAAYVTDMDSQNDTTASALKSLGDIVLPNGERTDAVHMFATMNMIQSGFGDLGGWCGDLCSLMQDMASLSGSVDELTDQASMRLGSASGQFGRQDLIADVDAVNIMASVSSGSSLSNAVKTYFSGNYNEYRRVKSFLANRFSGTAIDRSDLRSAVYTKYQTATGVSLLEIKNGVSGKTDLRRGCCNAFADYLYTTAVSYMLSYCWQGSAPSAALLPADNTLYPSEAEAASHADTTLTAGSVLYEDDRGQNGVWTFSGWSQSGVDDHIVTMSGNWAFAPLPCPEIILVGGKANESGVSTVSPLISCRGEIGSCTFALCYDSALSPTVEKQTDCTVSSSAGKTTVTVDHALSAGLTCPVKLKFQNATNQTVTVSSFTASYPGGRQIPETTGSSLTMGSDSVVIEFSDVGSDTVRLCIINAAYGVQAPTCTAVVACYNTDGKMLRVYAVDEIALSNGYAAISLDIDLSAVSQIKAFALSKDSCLPLAYQTKGLQP